MIQTVLREERLTVWDCLLRGIRVEPDELDTLLTKLAHAVSGEERAGTVLLVAVVRLSLSGTEPQRQKLLAILRYYFSHAGSRVVPENEIQEAWTDIGLSGVMGLQLNWAEAMRSVGRNGTNYTDLTRTKNLIRNQCRVEWLRMFGPSVPAELENGR